MANAYRADHVGSLVRPPELLQARRERAAGRLSAEELRQREDAAILEVLELQRQAGVDVYTDGELRRASWMSDMLESVEGFTEGGIQLPGSQRAVGARLRQVRRLTAHEVPFLREHAPGPFKITVPSAMTFAYVFYEPGLTDRFYASRRELLEELTAIVRNELAALADEGVGYIQVDAPRYTYYVDPEWRARLSQHDIDPTTSFAESIESDNACLAAAARPGVTTAIHLCRGNMWGRFFASGGYEPIAEQLFGSLRADRFLLEYDSDRAGGFEPLRFVPTGKTVVLGLVTTKSPELEPQDDLLRRVDEAARFVPLDHLAISPQCGFASADEGSPLTADEQRRKLELVANTARKIWG